MKNLLLIVVSLVSGVFTTIYSGWVLTKLWAWFVIPTFAAPMLSIPIAIGLALIVNYLTYQMDAAKKDEEKDAAIVVLKAVLIGLFKPTFALLIGWIITFWL